jgi:hypothetical protein
LAVTRKTGYSLPPSPSLRCGMNIRIPAISGVSAILLFHPFTVAADDEPLFK